MFINPVSNPVNKFLHFYDKILPDLADQGTQSQISGVMRYDMQ